MLTVFSTNGSPGASTVAIYIAAQWASEGRQVLLIETDPAGGSLSQKLGVQYTPGTASFVAASKPCTADSLVEHAQDVLLSDFHVMPAPSSPAGARSISETFAKMGDQLRDVSESDMAVIVDGGRLTADVGLSRLALCASAILVVSRNNSQLSSLEHLEHVLVDDPTQAGPVGLSLCVGDSPLTDDEWREHFGVEHVGDLDLALSPTTDLSMFMPRGKRKARKLLNKLSKIGDRLYKYAYAADAAGERPRLYLPDPDDEAEEAGAAGAEGALLPAVADDASLEPIQADLHTPVPGDAAGLPQVVAPPVVVAPHMQQAVNLHLNVPQPAAPALPPPVQYPYPPAYPPPVPPPPAGYPPPAPPGYPPAPAQPPAGAAPPYGQPPHAAQQPYPPAAHGGSPPPGYPATSDHGAPTWAGSEHGEPGAAAWAGSEHGEPGAALPAAEPEPEVPDVAEIEVPSVPTGSFRSWAAQLYGTESDGNGQPNSGQSA